MTREHRLAAIMPVRRNFNEGGFRDYVGHSKHQLTCPNID
jgi:hypothetical protein